MQKRHRPSCLLLALSMLTGCAATSVLSARENTRERSTAAAFGDYLVGRFAETQARLGVAADHLLRAQRLAPDNSYLAQQAFMAALMAGRPIAVPLAKTLPSNMVTDLVLFDADVAGGRWVAARERAASLSTEGVTQLLRPLLLAWAEQGDGETRAALATLAPLAANGPYSAAYALEAALIADLAHDPAIAGPFYQRAETGFGGTNLRLARILASWQARRGDSARAADTLRALGNGNDALQLALPALIAARAKPAVRTPRDGIAEVYLAMAASLHQQGAPDLSLLMLRLAIDMRPDLTEARLLMADELDAGHHPDQALAVLAEVPDGDPLEPVIEIRRAGLLQESGHNAEALAALRKLAASMPNRPEPYEAEGDLLRAQSRFAEAADAYTKAIGLIGHQRRSDWVIFFDRGESYERSNRWPLAEADLKHALELSPNQPEVLNYLGYCWAERGQNLPEAQRMIARAVKERPDDGSIIDSLGWVLLKEGKDKKAVRWLERAVELSPVDSTINGHLGDAYWAAGRRREAAYQWRRALSLNPTPNQIPALKAKLREAEDSTQIHPADLR